VLVDRERRPDPAPLRDVADAALGDAVRRQPEDLLAGEPHAAARGAGGLDEAGDRVAERGLAHAVAADDGEHAVIEREGDALQRVRAAVVDVEASDLEDRSRAALRAVAREPGHLSA
jgi:hypothetical protein